MNIFFTAAVRSSQASSFEVLNLLQKQDISLSYKIYPLRTIADATTPSPEHLKMTDAIIVDISYPVAPLYAIIAFTIMWSKPLQCLYRRGCYPEHLIKLLENQNANNILTVASYSKFIVSEIFNTFLKNVEMQCGNSLIRKVLKTKKVASVPFFKK